MSIGGQSSGGLRHLVVQNCTFESTGAGIRMKANRGSGGLVEDCTYENLNMKNVKYPIYITSYYPENGTPKSAADDPAKPVNATTPIWRNIRIRNVTSTDSPFAGRIIGLAEMPVSDVELDNVKISRSKGFDLWNVDNIRFVNSTITSKDAPAVERATRDQSQRDRSENRPAELSFLAETRSFLNVPAMCEKTIFQGRSIRSQNLCPTSDCISAINHKVRATEALSISSSGGFCFQL